MKFKSITELIMCKFWPSNFKLLVIFFFNVIIIENLLAFSKKINQESGMQIIIISCYAHY